MTIGDLKASRRTPFEPLELRRVRFAGQANPASVAVECGLQPAAMIGLFPFVADGSLVMVLTSLQNEVRNADLVLALGAAAVRRIQAPELLLGFSFGNSRGNAVYIDSSLLDHEEVLSASTHLSDTHGAHLTTCARRSTLV